MSLWQLLQIRDEEDVNLIPLKSYLVGLQTASPLEIHKQPARPQACTLQTGADDAEPQITMPQVRHNLLTMNLYRTRTSFTETDHEVVLPRRLLTRLRRVSCGSPRVPLRKKRVQSKMC